MTYLKARLSPQVSSLQLLILNTVLLELEEKGRKGVGNSQQDATGPREGSFTERGLQSKEQPEGAGEKAYGRFTETSGEAGRCRNSELSERIGLNSEDDSLILYKSRQTTAHTPNGVMAQVLELRTVLQF